MIRVTDDILSMHLQVALATAAPSLLDALAHGDHRRRHAVVGEIARHLVERLRCFDIRSEDALTGNPHPALFPDDLRPMG